MLVSLPTNSGESLLWSWLSGWAPCWRRKEAFSIRPRSTARKRGVWPLRVRHSRESGPETGGQDNSLFGLINIYHSSNLCFINGVLWYYEAVQNQIQTSECEFQDALVALSCCFMERSPTSAVCLWKPVSLSDTKVLQELLITWGDGRTVTPESPLSWTIMLT